MNRRHRAAITEGLARAGHVLSADRRYTLVVRKCWKLEKSDLFSGLVLEAAITRTLEGQATLVDPDTEEGQAFLHARDHAEAFLRWCRRHERRVAEIIAQASTNP
jgi:hypothetical protein